MGNLVPPGTPIAVEELVVPKAAELACVLQLSCVDYADLVGVTRLGNDEVVIFDLEPKLHEIRVNAINCVERIAAVFSATDDHTPEVCALREDFPWVPHLNLRDEEFPRSLCLYEESYRSLKRRWTAARFVADVRQWLSRTAAGSLHMEDQPLEAVLLGADGILVIPGDVFSPNPTGKPAQIFSLSRPDDGAQQVNRHAFVLSCPEREHGVVHRRPRTLSDLADMLDTEGVDLLSALRDHLREEFVDSAAFLGANLVLLILLPRTRVEGGPVEAPNLLAFQTGVKIRGSWEPAPIALVGSSIGALDRLGDRVFVSACVDESKRGEELLVEVLNPHLGMTLGSLAIQNGRDPDGEEPRLCAIGVGALGSQVVMNLARAGFGRWTLIDNDLLLPHNPARHVLSSESVGKPKASSVADLANSLTDGEDVFTAILANVFTSGPHEGEVHEALHSASAILDMSASVSVARYLAADNRAARCVSVFLSPTGADLVLLAEDASRALSLDMLEMQYYRACASDELAGHLQAPSSRLRYGQSCRDLTSRMPQHSVAVHSGIAAAAVPSVLSKPDARAAVWRSCEDGSVSLVEIPVFEAIRTTIGEWTVLTDVGFVSELQALRRAKLPCETGGVLLGSIDMDRSIIYIVDTIASPADSDEWPTSYTRGKSGLQAEVDCVKVKTDGMLEYIGEWHSHPRKSDVAPSDDDQKLFAYISEVMARDGLPAAMLIVGDAGRVGCYAGRIGDSEVLLPSGGGNGQNLA